jgi:hypothetical protein
VTGWENSRFSRQPVAEATQILMFYSLDNSSIDRRILADAAEFVQQKIVVIFAAPRAKDVVMYSLQTIPLISLMNSSARSIFHF